MYCQLLDVKLLAVVAYNKFNMAVAINNTFTWVMARRYSYLFVVEDISCEKTEVSVRA